MTAPLDRRSLDQLFLEARTHSHWASDPVPEATLRRLYDLLRMGPTSANCCPARFVFAASRAARERLAACVSDGNRAKVLAAPVTVIVGMDEKFYDRLPDLFPHNPDARNWFLEPAVAHATAFRNSSLQGAYLILAARALGLDCGPMSGFDPARVDAAFFEGTTIKSNFICSLGHGERARLHPRSPRLPFEDACRIE
ncbi:MAG: malonic semialdehyde reductase [Steroidobacteraceae bacterium]|jgi:3-hydroxypropanoate dehydrogenase|nr:malonic semialdehyde reductase [Steroidobacteraceae bacterium]